jgi:hypothetical protein
MKQKKPELSQTAQKIARRIKRTIKGKTTIRLSRFVYKFVLNPSRVEILQREYRYSKAATSNPLFSGYVVEAQTIIPSVIRYPAVCTNRPLVEKVDAMIAFSRRNEEFLQNCARRSASDVLAGYCLELDVKWAIFLNHSRVDLSRLSFDLPMSFMHGDFGPSNIGFRNGRLFIFDWEFAYEHGSILYDWWYMNHICKFMNYPNETIEKTSDFLQEGLIKASIKIDAFMYFCKLLNQLQTYQK